MNAFQNLLSGSMLSLLALQPICAAPDLYYRSTRSGEWSNVSVWETAEDSDFTLNVHSAVLSPEYSCRTIFIEAGDTVVISGSVQLDEVVVKTGGVLVYGNFSASVLTISDGPGTDLLVNGTLEDSGPANLVWLTAKASWALGEGATIVRTRSTSATLWRDHYENGMAFIPASSSWILRKQTVDPPSISGVNSYYGTLKIENNTPTFWNATIVGSKITGINSAPVIKGNFEIGTSGKSGVKFYSQNSAVNRILVKGDLRIGQGSEFHFEDATTTSGGSGVELQGNLTVQGILSYDPVEASAQNRLVKFSGQSDQYISGNGTISLYNLSNRKISGALILTRTISIDNKIFLDEGVLDLNTNLLILQNGSADAIERTHGWMKSETTDHTSRLAWNIGSTSGIHEFPFGKNEATFIPFSLQVSAGDVGMVTVSTYGTPASNLPLPVLPQLVTNLEINGVENSLHTADRFWYLTKTGNSGRAALYFSYAATEAPSGSAPLLARSYAVATDEWETPLCCQIQNAAAGNVMVPDVQNFSEWSLMQEDDALTLREETSGQNFSALSATENRVYPVPCQEEIFISYEAKEEGMIRIEVLDRVGKKITEKESPVEKGFTNLQIDLSGILEKGLWFVKITDASSVETFKIIRE